MTKALGWETDEDIERYIHEMAKAIDLPVEAEYVPNIIMFLKLAAEMAEKLDEADISPDDADLAPVFKLPGAEA